ncbi:unnamed protein product [Ectocarpus fasciculatus]
MGVCDRATGLCSCRTGFTGEACQRMGCLNDCNGRGRCMSMREAAALIDGDSLEFEGVYDGWDADMIYGCLCDDGWEGYDCSLRSCPKGVDPFPDIAGEDEEQLIDCYCPGQCSGSLRLAFRGHSTRPIPFDSSAELVKYRLEELDTVDVVSVNITGAGGMICSGNDGVTSRVAFLLQHGPLSNMTADVASLASTTDDPSVAVYAKGHASGLNPHLFSQIGTKDAKECSNRGSCNRQTGHCMCYSKFSSSDGMGGEGDMGDCGYYDWHDPPTNCTTATPVWGSTSALCSGVGDCDQETWRCNCTESYTGGACELRDCDSDVAWFEEAAWNVSSGAEGGRTGLSVQCSAGGVCDESTGICSCRSGMFSGDACEVMDCPTCNDVGICKDMEYFAATVISNGEAQEAYTYDLWDANKMRSCWCNRSMAVDNIFSGISTTYRGPYALADTDSYGYDCSLGRCPTGDHYHTPGVTDIQRVNCTAGWGVFTLSFRDETTVELDYFISAAGLEAALEETPGILDVNVTYTNGTTSACNDTEYIDIEFLTENGDLPLIKPSTDFLLRTDGTTPGLVTVEKVQTGTREDVECGAHGICLEEEGVCDCFVGYQSGDGSGGSGERGDCSWRNKYQTALFTENGVAYDYN